MKYILIVVLSFFTFSILAQSFEINELGSEITYTYASQKVDCWGDSTEVISTKSFPVTKRLVDTYISNLQEAIQKLEDKKKGNTLEKFESQLSIVQAEIEQEESNLVVEDNIEVLQNPERLQELYQEREQLNKFISKMNEIQSKIDSNNQRIARFQEESQVYQGCIVWSEGQTRIFDQNISIQNSDCSRYTDTNNDTFSIEGDGLVTGTGIDITGSTFTITSENYSINITGSNYSITKTDGVNADFVITYE